jgi:hypothetical protein
MRQHAGRDFQRAADPAHFLLAGRGELEIATNRVMNRVKSIDDM